MARVTMSEVKVGIMVVISVLLIIAISASVGNFNTLFQDNLTVYIRMPSVVGIEKYAPVKYAGVPIGTVSDIRYDDKAEMAVIEATIDYEAPVALDSDIEFASAGLLSALFVEITGGSRDKRLNTLIESGELDPAEGIYLDGTPYASIGDFFALASDVKEVLTKVGGLLDNAQEPLNAASGLVESLSGELQVIARETRELIQEARPRFRSILDQSGALIVNASGEAVPMLANLRETSEELSPFMKRGGAKVEAMLDQANSLIASVSPEVVDTMVEAKSLVASLNDRVEVVQERIATLLENLDKAVIDNRAEIDGILGNLNQTAANLNELSRQLKKDPWRIVWKSEGMNEPEKRSPEWDPFSEEGSN